MDIVTAHIYSFGLAALIAIAFGISLRLTRHQLLSRAVVGALFGGAALLVMLNPIQIAPGVNVDPRNLFVGLSAAFLGLVGATVSVLMAAAYRIELGGAGVYAGLLSLAISMAAGLLWAHLMEKKACTRPQCLVLLGAMISVNLAGTVLLPRPAMIELLTTAGLYIVVLNIVGAVLSGSLMERERIGAYRFRQLKEQATTDPLTGLLNRRGFSRSVEGLQANGRMSQAAVLVIDLDHFKQINDRHGHEVGDEILAKVGASLTDNVRKQDVVARFGGEEFVVLLPDTDAGIARLIGERLRVAIGGISLRGRGLDLLVSTSIGGFWAPGNFDHTEALRRADRALYRAKELGRNRTEFFGLEALAA